jgi:hypothetical protein
MSLTTDPKDPRLGHGSDDKPIPQHEVYLVLSEEERRKGFVRPVRRTYLHIGAPGPKNPLRDLTDDERERYKEFGYVKFEEYPAGDGVLGRFWKQRNLDNIDKGCGATTSMGQALAETYAREPSFYSSTYCCKCQMHRPVDEFVWDGTSERVGS